MPKPASLKDHKAAARWLTAKEVWCYDLAWKHALTLTRPCLRPEYAIEAATQEQRARVRLAAFLREIAERLYVLPTTPLSQSQQVSAEKAKEKFLARLKESAGWERDLLAVFHDPSLSVGQRMAARRHFRACRFQFRKREKKLYMQWSALSSAPSSGRLSHAKRFHDRLCAPGGEEAFFAWLDRLIQRYLKAKLRRESWIKSEPITSIPEGMSLPQLLTQAWSEGQTSQSEKTLVRRNRKSHKPAHPLHAFLRACLLRWEETTAAKGTHQQDQLIHHALSEGVYREQNGHFVGPFQCIPDDLPDLWHKKGLASDHRAKKEGLKLAAFLRRRSARSIANAKAAGFRVT